MVWQLGGVDGDSFWGVVVPVNQWSSDSVMVSVWQCGGVVVSVNQWS